MSYKSIQRKRKRRKIISFIIMFLIAYLFFKPILNVVSGGLKTTLPSKELLVEKIDVEGFFIRSEKVVNSDVDGILSIALEEGQRIGAGREVASIHRLKDNSSLEHEIIEVEEAIKTLEESGAKIEFIEDEKEEIQDLKSNIINEIQEKIINKDYSDINLVKEELILYEKKDNDVNFSGTLASQSIENLKNRKEAILSELKTNNIKYYTDKGGIISYDIDNYEDVYLVKDFENYTYEKLDSSSHLKKSQSKNKEKRDKEISIGEPVYKLVDDFEWYIAVKIENKKDITDLDVNRRVKLIIDKDKPAIRGNIICINEWKDKAVVVIKFNTMMYEYYNIRFSNVEMIKNETNALKIPRESIVNKEGQDGVYIKNKGGIVEFKPVFKIKQDEQYFYVQTGDNSSNVYLKEDSKPIKTITLFDEIILNTRNIKEGDIVN